MRDLLLLKISKGGPGSGRHAEGGNKDKDKGERKQREPNEKEHGAIGVWSGSGYTLMAALESGETLENPGPRITEYERKIGSEVTQEKLDEMKLHNEELNKYLNENSPIPPPVELFRGASHSLSFIQNNLQPGKEFQFSSKVSFSKDLNVATGFSNEGDMIPVIYQINSDRGVDVSHLSGIPQEKEYLMPKDNSFKIDKVEQEKTNEGFFRVRVTLKDAA